MSEAKMRIRSDRGLRVLGNLVAPAAGSFRHSATDPCGEQNMTMKHAFRHFKEEKHRHGLRTTEVLIIFFNLVIVGRGCANIETVADPALGNYGGTDADTEDICDGKDNDSEYETNEGCVCVPGSTVDCYDGPPETEDVSHCHGGTAQCADDGKSLGPCAGQSLPLTESCNLQDDNCDGQTDELASCTPCLRPNPDGTVSTTPWQEHSDYGQQCYSAVIDPRCDDSEYDYALNIPSQNDPGWVMHASANIDWARSTNELLLGCNAGQGCAGGGQFTYFQTFFFIGTLTDLSSARVQVNTIDDGVRVTLFNSVHPDGIVVPGGFLCMGDGGVTDDFSASLTTGFNRIVMTHLDDCPDWSALQHVEIIINGQTLSACTN